MGDPNQNSPLWRLYNAASNLNDQPYEGKGLSLVVCSIRHYILDASSANILFKTGTKNQVVPFDGYDLVVSDGVFYTVFAMADLRLSSLIQKKVLTAGSVITRATVRICFSERRSGHQFFLATDLSLDQERNIKVDIKKLIWITAFDQAHFTQPLLSVRLNYTSMWNISDPVGASWQNSSVIPKITDSKAIPRGYTLTEMLTNPHGKNMTPLLVRVFAKSRLNYFARKIGKRLDLNVCPYQFDVLIADDRGCCLAVFWGELAVAAYQNIEIGSVLLIRSYRIKDPFKALEYSACCFDPAIERFDAEISVSERLIGGKCPIEVVEPIAVLDTLRLAPVPFNFIPISLLSSSPAAMNDVKLDFAGVVVYAGRWHREARRFFRSANENDADQVSQDEGITEGIVVSSITGEKFLEEFNTGGFWMWRWLILTDDTGQSEGSSTTIHVKYYCTSQPAVQYQVHPSEVIAITQLRLAVLNKSEVANSRFPPKWCLTTTNESQLVNLSEVGPGSPFLRDERVVNVNEFAANWKSLLVFGGCYDYPPYPATFEALVERCQPAAQTNAIKPAEQNAREVVGPIYVAAPQLEALIDGFDFMEYRCLLVHALLASVRFIPFDDVVSQASANFGNETLKNPKLSSSGHPLLTLAAAWEERKLGFRKLGVELPHWRTLAWHWHSRFSDVALKKCVNVPSETIDTEDLSGSRLRLNPVDNFAGYLNVQLLMLNQSVYANCLVPVPESCCTQEALSRFSNDGLPGSRVIDFINSCCGSYNIIPEKASLATTTTRRQGDIPTKTMRTFFQSALPPSSPSSRAIVAPSKTSAILTCYGLGGDDVEISVKHLYMLS